MSETRKPAGRRTFLAGLLTGAGAVAALSTTAPKAGATRQPEAPPEPVPGPVLYRRTEDVERYYRTLYR